jgi:hypothetical protein
MAVANGSPVSFLCKEALLNGDAYALRRFADGISRLRHHLEWALPKTVKASGLFNHEGELLAVGWSGEVSVVEASGVVVYKGGEVLTNEAQIGRT